MKKLCQWVWITDFLMANYTIDNNATVRQHNRLIGFLLSEGL